MEERENLQAKIKVCMKITVAFIILLVVSVAAELVIIQFFGAAGWAKKIVRMLGFFAIASPFGITIPLFFRVNYQSKLLMLDRNVGNGGKNKEKKEEE